MGPEFLDWAFKGLISLVALYLAGVITKVKDSINELNVTVGVAISRQENTEEIQKDHEYRIRALESK